LFCAWKMHAAHIIASLLVVAVVTCASPLHGLDALPRRPSAQQPVVISNNNPCEGYGFDNSIVCLYCSVEELSPLLAAEDLSAISRAQLTTASDCIKNFCEACDLDEQCLTVNGKSLQPICEHVISNFDHMKEELAVLLIEAEIIAELESQFLESGSASGSGEYMSGSGSGEYIVTFFEEYSTSTSSSGDESSTSASGSGEPTLPPRTTMPPVAPSETTATPSITTPPPAPVAGSVHIQHIIRLANVESNLFQITDVIFALAQTYDVPTTAIYAKLESIRARSISVVISYTVVTTPQHSEYVLARMNNMVSEAVFINYLRGVSPAFSNVELDAASAPSVQPSTEPAQTKKTTSVLPLLAVIAGAACGIALVTLVAVALFHKKVKRSGLPRYTQDDTEAKKKLLAADDDDLEY